MEQHEHRYAASKNLVGSENNYFEVIKLLFSGKSFFEWKRNKTKQQKKSGGEGGE